MATIACTCDNILCALRRIAASAAAIPGMELDIPLLLSVTGGLGAFEQQPDGSTAFVRDDDCLGAHRPSAALAAVTAACTLCCREYTDMRVHLPSMLLQTSLTPAGRCGMLNLLLLSGTCSEATQQGSDVQG